MRAFAKAIGWSLAGSVLAGAFTFAGVFMYGRLFEPSDHADIRAWQTFGAGMGGFGVGVTVFVVAAVYGIARAFGSRNEAGKG